MVYRLSSVLDRGCATPTKVDLTDGSQGERKPAEKLTWRSTYEVRHPLARAGTLAPTLASGITESFCRKPTEPVPRPGRRFDCVRRLRDSLRRFRSSACGHGRR